MPAIISDAVDAYVIRRMNARLQFLLLQRRADAAFGGTWQAIHARVEPDETAMAAAERATREHVGIDATLTYIAAYVNQIFDHARDAVVLIPVFVFEIEAHLPIALSSEFFAFEWCERDEAASRLLWAGQRWSVRHIDDVIGRGGASAEFYRIR